MNEKKTEIFLRTSEVCHGPEHGGATFQQVVRAGRVAGACQVDITVGFL